MLVFLHLFVPYQFYTLFLSHQRVKELTEWVTKVRDSDSAVLPQEPEGVQYSMKFKAVTSTGGDDKGAAAKKAPAKEAPKKK
jgi:hypothetical protein